MLHHVDSGVPSNDGMRTIGEIRRLRLEQLLTAKNITLADLSEKLGRSRLDGTLSQIRNAAPNTRTGRARQMGDDQARQIEQVMSLPPGWMDRDPEIDALEAAVREMQRELAVVQEPPPSYSAWPFRRLDAARVRALSPEALAALETSLISAVQMAEALAGPPGKRLANG